MADVASLTEAGIETTKTILKKSTRLVASSVGRGSKCGQTAVTSPILVAPNFEQVDLSRDSHLDKVPGFVEFHLLEPARKITQNTF